MTSVSRLSAIETSINREIRKIERPKDSLGNALPISEYFGQYAFGLDQMKSKLSTEGFEQLMNLVKKGKSLPKETANEIASIVKDWALSHGATHFCHYFQPMTGLTAEKHDALISTKISEQGQTQVIDRLTGEAFLQQEPDASSFPSGGMRSTFEARGYTAWDPMSPVFIIENTNGKTICVPSAFISYSGYALDMKTPLLRSIQSVNEAATSFLKLVGDVDVKSVDVSLGLEQEYFLIDRAFFSMRPDLVMTGRSLLGRASTRGQQFEDHYFGSIPSRVLSFMQELEQEAYRLGLPLKTRHNEVAPSQFEVAPIFENANVSTDHNTLLMDMLRKVAQRHKLVCLLHEKPFSGVNGSGKHCNWSLQTDRGDNLLEPGKTPHQNLRFLAVLSVILKAVHEHAALLRAGIASPGNDHRLGANEAPPAIMSIFLGDTLSKICDRLEKGEVLEDSPAETVISLGVAHLPAVSKDNTDRNRTSPFAFTGNKFEFRAVGSSSNVAVPIMFLNAAVSASFRDFSAQLKELLDSGKARDEALLSLIQKSMKEAKAIRFEGNNYSEEWIAEAKKRGLPHLKNTPEALQVLGDEKRVSFLHELKILNPQELTARHHVALERYNKQIEMEAATLLEMVETSIIPPAEAELSRRSALAESLKAWGAKEPSFEGAKERKEVLSKLYSELLTQLASLKKDLDSASRMEDEEKRSLRLADKVIPSMEALRSVADDLEAQVSDELWPLPKYREMLFLN
ncbi:MAG: glutamine synthetase type III [Bradymonadales bacterium]|nr:MAG: glutamine synthetase type III [Bradymonadales bacterium]